MWKFWAILGVAMLAGAAFVITQLRPSAPKDPAREVARPTPAPSKPEPAVTPSQPSPKPPVEVEAKPRETPAPPVPEVAAKQETTEVEPAPAPAETPDKSGGFEELVPTNPTPDLTPTPEPPTPETTTPEPAPENLRKLRDFVITPGKVEKRDDGSLLLDGKYTLKGEGTQASPYLVSWDLLVSAEEGFDPQNGKRRIPERIAMLDGKTVRLNGYIAFPMTSTEPRELLSMLNQWDGCCIGTPPTPYDAVEVALTDVVEGDDRFATTGKVVGTFHVKPYLEGDWLIGLYVMDDAKLTPRDFGPGAN